MDKLRRVLNGVDQTDQDEETGIMGQISDTFNKRSIKAFIIMFLIGILCSFLASVCLFVGLRLAGFAVFYTLGNLFSIGSTCFLLGPLNQLKKMFDKSRVIATVLVIVMFCLTMYAAFVVKRPPLVLLFIILQSLAMTWYSLSYIPYARTVVKSAVSSCLG